MASFYACDDRLRKKLDTIEPTPGYCIFIDLVDSVALKDKGLGVWCGVMYNLIAPATSWLRGLNGGAEIVERDSPPGPPAALPPLKILGDCLMFYIAKRRMPRGANALTIFDALLNIVRVSKELSRDVRPEVHAAVTSCEHAYEVTFVDGTDDIHGKDIDLAAKLVEEAGAQELLMNQTFYREAQCDFLNWRDARNVRPPEDGYEQFATVQGPLTRSIKGFKERLDIYKWCGPRFSACDRPSARS